MCYPAVYTIGEGGGVAVGWAPWPWRQHPATADRLVGDIAGVLRGAWSHGDLNGDLW